MRLKLTLNRPSGTPADIIVTTDAAASISEVATAIARLDPMGGGTQALASAPPSDEAPLTLRAKLPGQAEPVPLPPDVPVGEAWIASGAVVQLMPADVHFAGKDAAGRIDVATVTVLSGPDAGSRFPLTQGTTILGRGPDCDIVLHDDLVSKRHVRFETSDSVEAVDLGSANGIVVDGGIVPRLRITREETLLIGDSELRVTITHPDATPVALRAGPVFFNRSPRVEVRYAGHEFAAPEVPAKLEPQPFPLLAMIAPLLVGGLMFAFSQQITSLLFILMSPVMMVGNAMTEKTRGKRRLKKSIVEFDERLSVLADELDRELITERELRSRESPSTEDVFEQAVRRGPWLWTRRPEHWSFLTVRLGVGRMKSRNTITVAPRGRSSRSTRTAWTTWSPAARRSRTFRSSTTCSSPARSESPDRRIRPSAASTRSWCSSRRCTRRRNWRWPRWCLRAGRRNSSGSSGSPTPRAPSLRSQSGISPTVRRVEPFSSLRSRDWSTPVSHPGRCSAAAP
ncbi:FHA domain-containing protein [Leifsonia sp. L25]|uniref:FHA domain-containing protein n=1 Tax=Actinomycetes TaxID=1760 RepID=UPI003D696DDF